MEDIRAVVGVILYPFQELVDTPARMARGMANYFSLQSTLRSENTRLREEAFVNAGLLQKQQDLIAENANLRELLDLGPRFEPSSQVASIEPTILSRRDAMALCRERP